ncbi:MAG TPA: hypothetical protein VF531_13555 [Bacillota bacterium]
MRKLILVMMAIGLIVAMSVSAFAYTELPITREAGHPDADGLQIAKSGDFLYVNPFAAVKLVGITPAILEGDGYHLVSTGNVSFALACNSPVKLVVTASQFTAKDDVLHPNHYRGEGDSYNIVTPLLASSANGTYANSVVLTKPNDGGSYPGPAAANYDEWTYENQKVYFQVTAPVDRLNPYTLNNIDELHAGWYTGTIYFTVTQNGEAGEGTFDIIEPVGGHQDLPDNFFDDYQAQ